MGLSQEEAKKSLLRASLQVVHEVLASQSTPYLVVIFTANVKTQAVRIGK